MPCGKCTAPVKPGYSTKGNKSTQREGTNYGHRGLGQVTPLDSYQLPVAVTFITNGASDQNRQINLQSTEEDRFRQNKEPAEDHEKRILTSKATRQAVSTPKQYQISGNYYNLRSKQAINSVPNTNEGADQQAAQPEQTTDKEKCGKSPPEQPRVIRLPRSQAQNPAQPIREQGSPA